MKIFRADAEAIQAAARAGHPFEVYGVFLGQDGGSPAVRVVRALAVLNRESETPRVRYQIAPEDLLRIQREAREEGLEIVGYYHSHPDHPARPSETDRRIAAEGLSDGVVHVVVGVTGAGETEATAWVFRDRTQSFEPEPFEVE
jgi:proteasome lid subunit RPN8/RPN11